MDSMSRPVLFAMILALVAAVARPVPGWAGISLTNEWPRSAST